MSETKPIHVMIVDDHEMVRSGLATFLSGYEHLILVAQATNGQEALRFCSQHQIDVILMDLVMPGMDGIDAIRAIKKDYPRIQIIALTSYTEQELLQRALEAGATGYLLKDVTVDALASAIEVSHAGMPAIAPQATQMLIDIVTQEPPQSSETCFDLTPRELEVLKLLARGMTNRQIAVKLELSSATVKSYVSNILMKMSAASRAEAVASAMQNHILDS